MDLETLRRMHPEWSVVDFKVAPNGGLWALGSDGGVFSLDATGGTTGLTAPYLGSYTALPAAQRQGNRTFNRLDLNPAGGYNLISTNQERYGFNAPLPATPTAAPAVDKTGTTQATGIPTSGSDVSGSGALHAILDPIGLGGLADQALTALHGTPGADGAYISQVWLPQQEAYKKAFPEIAATQAQVAKGLATHVPTAAEIVTYRQTAKTLADQGIIPAEFVTNDQVSKLITGGVSVDEFQRRVLRGVDELTNADPADRAAFMAYHPSVDFSHAVAAFLDPTMSEAAIQRSVTQAEIGGAAIRSGFGPISAAQATGIQAAGVSAAQAGQDLTNLALQQPLFANTAAETTAGQNITRDEQLATITGDANAITDIARRRATRQAAFQGGGGAASGGGGRQGIG